MHLNYNIYILTAMIKNTCSKLPRLTILGACVLLSSSLSSQTLLSRYTLDGTTNDSGSIGANGTLNGGATYISNAPGNFSQALDLTGTGSRYLEANVGTNFDGLDQMTFTFWVNLQANPAENDRFVSTLQASSLDGFDIRTTADDTASSFQLSYNVNTTNSPATSNSFSANNSWTFIAVSYDGTLGSDQVKYYSGTESVAASFLNASSETGSLDTSSLLRIGSTPASGADRTPSAYFSDVRVYSGVLDANAIDGVRSSVIPEPGTYAMIAGLFGLAYVMVRRR